LRFPRTETATRCHPATFVRSFAYATGPAYGLLLDRYAPAWHTELKKGATFDALLRRSLRVTPPVNLRHAAEQRAAQYGGPTLLTAERAREIERQKVLARYRAAFIDGPVLTLHFRHMNVQFNPRNLQPLGDAGTVYPTMRISDDWGVLDAKNGALMKSDWSAVIVSAPASSEGSILNGEGWTLELKPGWKIVPGSRKGDFELPSGS
jgi:hypothetical protein